MKRGGVRERLRNIVQWRGGETWGVAKGVDTKVEGVKTKVKRLETKAEKLETKVITIRKKFRTIHHPTSPYN